jgi:hypothetical protein
MRTLLMLVLSAAALVGCSSTYGAPCETDAECGSRLKCIEQKHGVTGGECTSTTKACGIMCTGTSDPCTALKDDTGGPAFCVQVCDALYQCIVPNKV